MKLGVPSLNVDRETKPFASKTEYVKHIECPTKKVPPGLFVNSKYLLKTMFWPNGPSLAEERS